MSCKTESEMLNEFEELLDSLSKYIKARWLNDVLIAELDKNAIKIQLEMMLKSDWLKDE